MSPLGAGKTSGQGGTLTRLGHSVNAGAKLGRILRVVRVVRTLLAAREYRRRVARASSAAGRLSGSGTRRLENPREEKMRVGEKLGDLTTRCVRMGGRV